MSEQQEAKALRRAKRRIKAAAELAVEMLAALKEAEGYLEAGDDTQRGAAEKIRVVIGKVEEVNKSDLPNAHRR